MGVHAMSPVANPPILYVRPQNTSSRDGYIGGRVVACVGPTNSQNAHQSHNFVLGGSCSLSCSAAVDGLYLKHLYRHAR